MFCKPLHLLLFVLSALSVSLPARAAEPEARVAAVREWVRTSPEDWQAHMSLGYALEAVGSSDEALSAYRRAVELASDVDAPLIALGSFLGRQERWKEAEAVFAKAQGADYPLGWYGQGVARAKLGDKKAAQRWYKKLKEDGEAVLAQRLLAVIRNPRSPVLLGAPAYQVP